MKKVNLILLGVLFTICSNAQNLVKHSDSSVKHESKNSSELYAADLIKTNNDFKAYVEKLNDQLAMNDNSIQSLKNNFSSVKVDYRKKVSKALDEFTTENNELKKELNIYVENGVGDWKIFRKEFNASVQPLVQDLTSMIEMFKTDDFLAGNSK